MCSGKEVICADGKLLKCPEGSNSSVLVKTGRICRRLTHRCLERSALEAGSAVLLCSSRCLGSHVGRTQALFLLMSKWLRPLGELPGARRWGETFWHVVHTVITNWGSGLLLSLGCCSLFLTHCTASGHCLAACLPIVVLIIHSLLAQNNYFLHSARSSSCLSLLVHGQRRSEKKQVS